MTPIEAFRYLLVTMLVANWLCGFAASCAVGVGPDWHSTKRFVRLAPALWERALDAYERLARRAARLVRRAALWFETLRRRWMPAESNLEHSPSAAVAVPGISAEAIEAERAARCQDLLADLLSAMSVWNAWSARRRLRSAELDRLCSDSMLDLKSLRLSADALRNTMGEGDVEWNSLFELMKAFDDADGHGPLGDVLGKYRRDAKLLGAAVFASAAGADAKKLDEGRRKIRDVLASDAHTLDRICRTTFAETAKLLGPVKARDAATFEVADPASSLVQACLWASRNLGPTYSIALLEPLEPLDPAERPTAVRRVERAELLRAELRDVLGVDEILVRGSEPFVAILSPASSGRALAARLEVLRSSWIDRQRAGSTEDDGSFVGAVHAAVVASSPDEDVFGAFARLVAVHDRTCSESPGRVALAEGSVVTVLEPRDARTAEPPASPASAETMGAVAEAPAESAKDLEPASV